MSRTKITDEMLADAVRISFSFAEVMRILGLKGVGGNHTHYSRRAKNLQLDMSHFTGQLWSKGKTLPKKRVAENILVDRTETKGSRQKSSMLTRALLEISIPHCCDKCGQLPEWLGFPLTLDVDHINENWLDDRRENLRFLCPNCHSQFSRHLLEPKKIVTRKYVKPKHEFKINKPCLCCHNPVKSNKNDYCSYECAKKSQEHNDWSSIDLVKLVETDNHSFVSLSKIYEVSDNTIKKWYLRQKNDTRVAEACQE